MPPTVNDLSPARYRQSRPSTVCPPVRIAELALTDSKSASGHGSARRRATSDPETPNQAAARIFHDLMEAAGNPSCHHCIHDLKIESRRQVAGTHGAVFSQFAHGLKPQILSALPSVAGLINIPFTPKPIGNQTLYGVSLAEILDFRDVLADPRERALDNSLNKIFLTIEVRPKLIFHLRDRSTPTAPRIPIRGQTNIRQLPTSSCLAIQPRVQCR
jgi:hypothetical protein